MVHQRQLSPTVFLDKMKRIYRPRSILVRREQEKYFFRLKTAVIYGPVKFQGFFSLRSQQLRYKIVYTCIDVISSELKGIQRKIRNT